ncbi:hypothetical protein MMC12_006938 [Toensbergia leucococca]|nr:hypothetical protein [Toensbergia leucococca]
MPFPIRLTVLLFILAFKTILIVTASVEPHLHPTTNPIAIRIISSNNSFTSSSTTTLTPTHHQKRTPLRPIFTCPNGYAVDYSFCRRAISPQAFRLICTIAGRWSRESGIPRLMAIDNNCAADEVCVSVHNAYPAGSAVTCVGLDEMVRYMVSGNEDKKTQDVSAGASQVGLPATSAAGSSQYALEAVLTGADTAQSLNASSLRVQALKAVNVHGNILWQTLPGGLGSCTECAGVSMDPVPDGTQSVSVDVALDPGVGAGNLFLGSFEL